MLKCDNDLTSKIGKYVGLITESKKLNYSALNQYNDLTIFDIGGRGYFENPLSDMLSFYFDPQKPHGFGNVILHALWECICKKAKIPLISADEIELVNEPSREFTTDKKNRVDLLLEGNSWAIIIENKVYAKADNPFQNYLSFFCDRLKGKRIIPVILSLAKIEIPEWINITYKELITTIKEMLKDIDMSRCKWGIVFNDFLLHVENLIGENKMNDEHFKFVSNNYKDISKMVELRERYFKALVAKCIHVLTDEGAAGDILPSWGKENWGEIGTALRFRTEKWGTSRNIVLIVQPDGQFFSRFYIFNITQENKPIIQEYFKPLVEMEPWLEKGNTILCYQMPIVSSLDAAIVQFTSVVRSLNALK